LTTPFLGVTAHYFSHKDKQRCNVTLAVTRLPPSHTATKIHDTINLVLDQWNIPKNKIFHIVTDNGSNMVAAFKRHSLGDDSENEDNFANHNHVTLDPVDLKP